QVNTVATVLGAHRRVALNLVADNLHVLGAVGPDAEARATQPVVAYDHAIGAAPDEDRRVHLGAVLAPVTQVAVFARHIVGADGQHIAPSRRAQHGARCALQP